MNTALDRYVQKATRQAVAQAMAQIRAETRAETQAQMAKRFYALGVSIDIIAKAYHVSKNTVRAWLRGSCQPK